MAARRKTKRAKNTGGINKRTVTRKDGSTYERWQGRVTVGYDAEGEQQREYVYGITQAEVIEKMQILQQKLANGSYSNIKLKVKAYLEQWLEEKERHVKPTTHEVYEYAARCLYPHVGSIRLDKLTTLQIQTALNKISDKHGRAAANKCRRVLFSAYRQAIKWQLVTRNPVEAIDVLKEVRREQVLWSPEEAARFLTTARTHRLYALFYLGMATGLRRCELLGLCWQDIKGNVLHVRQTLVKAKGKLEFSTPKTAKGTRHVSLSPDVLEVLLLHRQLQDAERRDSWPESSLVFVSETGTPLNPDNLTRLRKQLLKAAQVPEARLHDLRHLHASVAIKSGIDPKVLADRLGHARASFTLDVYTHLFEEQRVNSAVSLLDFLPKVESKSPN